jgi:hypothetical protein
MSMSKLTEEGRRYANQTRHSSTVAAVALAGYDSSWPEQHVTLAIDTINAEAVRNAPRRIDYDLMSREHPKMKAKLTRAKNSGDPMKILDAVEAAFDIFDRCGAWPDDWATWNIALSDMRWSRTLRDLDDEQRFAVEVKLTALEARVR